MTRYALFVALVSAFPQAAIAQQVPAPAAALQPVVEAAARHRPSRDVAAVALEMRGTRFAPEQARDPATPVADVDAEQTVLLTQDGRFRLETRTRYPGAIEFGFLTVGSRDGEATIDTLIWREGIEIQRDPAETARRDFADLQLLSPVLLLRSALADARRAADENGNAVLTFDDGSGREIAMTIDAGSGLPLSVRADNERYLYTDWRDGGGLMQPAHVERYRGEHKIADWPAIVARPLAVVPAQSFRLPDGYVERQSRGTLRATHLGGAAWRIDGAPSGYHTGFVVGARAVAVFDAPVSPEEAAQVIEVIRRAAPGRSIGPVIVSHVHGDHVAGLPAYLREGAQVWAGVGAGVALRRQLGEDAAARLREMAQPERIDLGGVEVTVYPVTSTHASTMLASYEPQSRTLFQGDLFYLPEVGPMPPPFDGAAELAGLIASGRLDVVHIVGVHGRSATMADLDAALALPRGANPPVEANAAH